MPEEGGVVLERVSKHFGDVVAVDGVSLTVERGEFVSLLGPSGCGKTTLLRLIGGFEEPDAGRIHIAGQDVTDVPALERLTVMVFQSYALFPNLTVAGNVAYGLQVRRIPKETIRQRVTAALAKVGLDGLQEREVGRLSGGQQQRVALARALAVEPQVLLFDEPLSNLDLALREETRRELKALQRDLGTTSIYVTHDQQEALALSDRIAVMANGVIIEEGTPEKLYEEPQSAFVAGFLGGSNLIEDPSLVDVIVGAAARQPGHLLSIRPTSWRVAEEGQEGAIRARLLARQFLGPYAEWALEVDTTGGPTLIRLWTSPSTAVPEPLFIRAAAYQWVRA